MCLIFLLFPQLWELSEDDRSRRTRVQCHFMGHRRPGRLRETEASVLSECEWWFNVLMGCVRMHRDGRRDWAGNAFGFLKMNWWDDVEFSEPVPNYAYKVSNKLLSNFKCVLNVINQNLESTINPNIFSYIFFSFEAITRFSLIKLIWRLKGILNI